MVAAPKLDLSRIGGSDTPAVMGLFYPEIAEQLEREHPGRYSAYALWCRIVHGFRGTTNEAMRWGKRFERPIFDGWLEDTGRSPDEWVWCSQSSTPATGNDYRPWLRVSPDALRWVRVGDDPAEGAEVKFLEPRQAGDLREGVVGIAHELQCQTYMHAFDTPRWYLVAMVGQQIHETPIDRSPELGMAIMESCEKFLRDYVVTRRAPPMDGGASAKQAISWKWGAAGPATPPRPATVDELEAIADLEAACRNLRKAEAWEERAKNLVRDSIGDCDGIEWTDNGRTKRITNRRGKGRSEIETLELLNALVRRQVISPQMKDDLVQEFTKTGEPFRTLRHPFAREE